jgi:hypothetical protein
MVRTHGAHGGRLEGVIGVRGADPPGVAPLRRVLLTTLGYSYGPFPAVRVERFVERRAR